MAQAKSPESSDSTVASDAPSSPFPRRSFDPSGPERFSTPAPVDPNADVFVVFTGQFRVYFPGDVAAFPPAEATQLVASGWAELTPDPALATGDPDVLVAAAPGKRLEPIPVRQSVLNERAALAAERERERARVAAETAPGVVSDPAPVAAAPPAPWTPTPPPAPFVPATDAGEAPV